MVAHCDASFAGTKSSWRELVNLRILNSTTHLRRVHVSETVNCPVYNWPGCFNSSPASKADPFPLGHRYDCRRCENLILPDKYGQLRELSFDSVLS
jgi:hypothetical protein